MEKPHIVSPITFLPGKKPKLLDEVKSILRVKHYSKRTEDVYIKWIKDYIVYHNKRHPKEMGAEEIKIFINYLANNKHVSASTQNQAINAILFLYREVLKIEIGWIEEIKRVARIKHIPSVFSKDEAKNVLENMNGVPRFNCLFTLWRRIKIKRVPEIKSKRYRF